MRLLRAQHAPFVVAFLFERFKKSAATAVSQAELLAELAAWLDEVRETYPDAPRNRAEHYLAEWSSGDRRWIVRRTVAGRDGWFYELSPHTKQALTFLDAALECELGFVATGSPLRIVIETLEQVVVSASGDPAAHLARLRAEQARIAFEIETIERDGAVAAAPPARVQEEFAVAVSLLKRLQSDFRAVEERFRKIAADVPRRQVGSPEPRGGILADALDAEDALQREGQGVSFFAFLRFIHSPKEQERLREVVRQVARLPGPAGQADGLEAVGRMVPSLLAEAEAARRRRPAAGTVPGTGPAASHRLAAAARPRPRRGRRARPGDARRTAGGPSRPRPA